MSTAIRFALYCGVMVLASQVAACQTTRIADPKETLAAYKVACAKGDADALYAMLSEDARRELSKQDLKKLVSEQRAELAAQGASLSQKDTRLAATAKVALSEGDEISFELVDGAFKLSAAGTMPGGAASPEDALRQLRRALIRKNYAALLGLLTPATRKALEDDLASLIEGLARPESLHANVVGETATILVPFGHQVRVRKSGGIWRVEDFD